MQTGGRTRGLSGKKVRRFSRKPAGLFQKTCSAFSAKWRDFSGKKISFATASLPRYAAGCGILQRIEVMKNCFSFVLFFLAALFPFSESRAQSGFVLVEQALPNPDNEPAPLHPLPTERQLAWHEVEFYAFFHYGLNTYTGQEWGSGGEDPALFVPTARPDVRQWLAAAKAARMKGGIAVVKHHDGFCLWPTAATDYNCQIAGGNAYARELDLPRDFAEAAREAGLKFGFYVSPWDRNSAYYGTRRYIERCSGLNAGSLPPTMGEETCSNSGSTEPTAVTDTTAVPTNPAPSLRFIMTSPTSTRSFTAWPRTACSGAWEARRAG